MTKHKYFLSLITVLLSAHLSAQTNLNGTIDGKLSDEKFKPLSGVTIFLQETGSNNIVDSVTAKPDGTFKFSLVKSGLHQIIFKQVNGVSDSSFIFSMGQLYPLHNKKLVLSFVFSNNFYNGKLKLQRRQFGGTYAEWFTSVPANLLVNLIAEYERPASEIKNNIIGTTLNNSVRSIGKTTVTLFSKIEGKKIAETISDDMGKYAFAQIPSGIYYLVFTKNEKNCKGGFFEVKTGWLVILKDTFRNL